MLGLNDYQKMTIDKSYKTVYCTSKSSTEGTLSSNFQYVCNLVLNHPWKQIGALF